jgi:hypothetical protein
MRCATFGNALLKEPALRIERCHQEQFPGPASGFSRPFR